MFIETPCRSRDHWWWAAILGAAWLFTGSMAAAQSTNPSFPFPDPITFQGRQIVLDLVDASGLGAGTVLRFKVKQGDGSFETFTTQTDAGGRFTIALDATGLADLDTIEVLIERSGQWQKTFTTLRRSPDSPSNHTPTQPSTNLPVPICTSEDCGAKGCGAFSPEIFTQSNEAQNGGVNLADGTVITHLPVLAFPTRLLGFDLVLHHQSLTQYDGPVGNWSHTFNTFVVQVSDREAAVVTPDLRRFSFFRDSGGTWSPPEGFFGRLERDETLQRWIFTHHTGTRFEFLLGLQGLAGPALSRPGLPGPLIGIEEPNGNRTRARLDPSGFLATVETDLGQTVSFTYGPDSRLASVTDPIGRTWTFAYDVRGNLTRVTSPATQFAALQAGQEITEADLPRVLVTRGRTTSFFYEDPKFPGQITRVTDDRGAVPVAYTYVQEGPDLGRIAVERRNGRDIAFTYNPTASQRPFPLTPLEIGNTITRVIDREGNVTDHEIHGLAGGPLDHKGAFGLRRRVQWTESGKGNPPLRPGEPLYWEQRWLHACDCLSPEKIGQPFRSDDALTFDNQGMPAGYPTEIFGYNTHRQITSYEFRGGTGESIQWQKTYDTVERFSRMLSYTEPRGFDDNPLYAGLDFTHTYRYDEAGNLIEHRAPTVRRGVAGEQVIVEAWTYNEFGQGLTHRDPNGNLTVNTYFTGLIGGGNINTRGELGGYLASTTRGAPGSTDPAPGLTTRFRVNALGMVTERTDPKGFVYGTEYNDLGETIRQIEPEVTLANGTKAQYETRFLYDGAGNRILERLRNVDFDGTVPSGEFIDRAMSHDAVNNLLSLRIEVDEDEAHDLVTRYAYDGNDQQSAVQKPEGNRAFMIYDERRLPFKSFYGISPGPAPAASYPVDKRAQDLGGTPFVGFTASTYDARENAVQERDGRGNLTRRFYDFANRRTAERDPNGNGMSYVFDDASNVITERGGAVSLNGTVDGPLKRSYHRFDEAGRQYQTVRDIDLASDESITIDPDDGRSSSYRTAFDPGGRIVRRTDAEGNVTASSYDAASRTSAVTDAVRNIRSYVYDPNSNIIEVQELEVPGRPDPTGLEELYVTTYELDELNRRVEIHVRGLNGNSIDHVTTFAWDSRNNLRRAMDAEGNFTVSTFDARDRLILSQRFAGRDGTELTHSEHAYDRNDNKTLDIARKEVDDPGSAEITRYAYDTWDRRVRTVYPDSDDPIDGSSDGPDGTYDRVEIGYDASSNAVSTRDQRGVVLQGLFDPGNRLVRQDVIPIPGLPGERRRRYVYDALNRVNRARNDYSVTVRDYDPLSRLVTETQSLRLDGSGFTRGYQVPIRINFTYDRQGNRLSLGIPDRTDPQTVRRDLDVEYAYDPLNRVESIQARHFADTELRPIVGYEYFGPFRVTRKTLGNGSVLFNSYDPKRRISGHEWVAIENGSRTTLAGFEYDYDRVDNALFERFLHDDKRYDNFGYNPRYEVTGVNFSASTPLDYRTFTGNFRDTFAYDDLFNRTRADFGDPLDRQPNTVDSYAANAVNEYTEIVRNGVSFVPVYDKAGNATSLPVRPRSGPENGRDVQAAARYDAFNQLFEIQAGANARQHYRYDALGRRVATLEVLATTAATAILPGSRRFVYDGSSEVMEHLFNTGATLAEAQSRLERVYIHGPRIDELLLTAVDGNGDRSLDGKPGHPENTPGSPDLEYYALDNRIGSVMTLLDADDAGIVLESYRYNAYGELTVLKPFSVGPALTQTLSPSVNPVLFTGRRLDGETGLYYYRMRYMEPRMGRFIARDPINSWGVAIQAGNAYHYVRNQPPNLVDPMGLWPWDTERDVLKPPRPRPWCICVTAEGCPCDTLEDIIWGPGKLPSASLGFDHAPIGSAIKPSWPGLFCICVTAEGCLCDTLEDFIWAPGKLPGASRGLDHASLWKEEPWPQVGHEGTPLPVPACGGGGIGSEDRVLALNGKIEGGKAGAIAGLLAGALYGAQAGSFFGVPGFVAGAVGGAIGGFIGGYLASDR